MITQARKLLVTIVAVITILSLSACGNKNDSANESEQYATRGEWIQLLGESFGLERFVSDQPYYSDIIPEDPLFPYVQAETEWKILSIYANDKKLNVQTPVTREEVASTVAIAVGFEVDETQFNKKGDFDTAQSTNYAISTGLVSSNDSMAQYVTMEECLAVVHKAKSVFLNKPRGNILDVTYNEDFIDLREINENEITVDGNRVYVANAYIIGDARANDRKAGITLNSKKMELSVGQTFALTQGGTDAAYKIVEIQEHEGMAVFITEEPSLPDIYDALSIHTSVDAKRNNILWADDVSAGTLSAGNRPAVERGNFYAATLSGNHNMYSLQSLGKETDDLIFSKDIVISDGECERVWKKSSAGVLGDGESVEKFDSSNFVYDKMPDIHDFDGGNNYWIEVLPKENKFSGGYTITGNISVHSLDIAVDMDYTSGAFKICNGISINSEISAALTLEGNLSEKLKIATIPCPIGATGISVDVDIYLFADASGSLQIEAAFGNGARVEWNGSGNLKRTVTSDASVNVQAAIELDVGAEICASLNAFEVTIIDLGITAGGNATVNAFVEGKCEVASGKEEEVFTYTEAMNLEGQLYYPIVSFYVGSDDSVLGEIGASGSWDIIDQEKARRRTFLDEEWVFWTATVTKDSSGTIIDTKIEPSMSEEEQAILSALSGDFSYFAGTYAADDMFNNAYGGGAPLNKLTLAANGVIRGGDPYYSKDLYSDTPPISITLNDDGSIKCLLRYEEGTADYSQPGWEDDLGWNEYYVIYPVGISTPYGSNNSDVVRIECLQFSGGVVDIVYYKID